MSDRLSLGLGRIEQITKIRSRKEMGVTVSLWYENCGREPVPVDEVAVTFTGPPAFEPGRYALRPAFVAQPTDMDHPRQCRGHVKVPVTDPGLFEKEDVEIITALEAAGMYVSLTEADQSSASADWA